MTLQDNDILATDEHAAMFWKWCSTQNQSVLSFVGFLRRSVAAFIICLWPEKNQSKIFSKKKVKIKFLIKKYRFTTFAYNLSGL